MPKYVSRNGEWVPAKDTAPVVITKEIVEETAKEEVKEAAIEVVTPVKKVHKPRAKKVKTDTNSNQ